jgi:hypothetical protein
VPSSSNIDILIAPDKFSQDDRELLADITTEVQNIFSHSGLPRAILDKIKFHYLNDYSVNFNIGHVDNDASKGLTYSNSIVNDVKGVCEADWVVVLGRNELATSSNNRIVLGEAVHCGDRLGAFVDNGALGGGNATVTGNIITHELGHLACLKDEYTFTNESGPIADSELPTEAEVDENCYIPSTNDSNNCAGWTNGNQTHSECFKGCGYANWFRPSDKSIMKNPDQSLEFNLPSVWIWEEEVNRYR